MKYCNICHKPGIYNRSQCREHYNEYQRGYRKKNRQKITEIERNRRKRKGYDPTAPWGMKNSRAGSSLARSGVAYGACAVCSVEEILVQDHNHITGQIRDYICQRCNVIIGPLADDKDLLRTVQQYAVRWWVKQNVDKL
jgi:hypothetical protein